jgi:signal transduction histidine kinase/phage shock protein PspC (stress-responsive transcriptional regulator)
MVAAAGPAYHRTCAKRPRHHAARRRWSEEGTISQTSTRTPKEAGGPGAPRRRLVPAWSVARSADDRVIAGVAAGLGERFGIDPVLVRTAFVVLATAAGAGVALYLLAWGLSHEPQPGEPAPRRRPGGARSAVALGLIVFGLLLVLREARIWFGDTLVWPVALAGAGFAVLWTRSDSSDRARWAAARRRLPGNPLEAVFAGRVSFVRVAVGALLVAAGMGAFLGGNEALAVLPTVLLAIGVTITGLALILGPWIVRLTRQLGEERRQRIRSEERAEVAAHLHDSVLHTLALIQRADAAPEVTTLARRQERELRAWLYGRPDGSGGERLSDAIEAMADRVEQHHQVAVDAVVVGDRPMDEHARAIVQACQEAVVNAAKHSGSAQVSVYVEVEPEAITAFVRDQGKGFDPAAVPEDRRGIAESIRGRMRRHGGSATVASEPGEGTEVTLHLPLEGP